MSELASGSLDCKGHKQARNGEKSGLLQINRISSAMPKHAEIENNKLKIKEIRKINFLASAAFSLFNRSVSVYCLVY